MTDIKDRLGDKLREKEQAEEDKYFAAKDEAALQKLRADAESVLGPAPHGRCPRCQAGLVTKKEYGVAVDECPSGHGMWLDRGELETIANRERDGWIGRYFYRPKLEG
jgi:hypothetical protein